ncbi:MAG: fatty acid desaturase [Leptolyngbyaceae cyanobacterium bins.59]|nr:fatty acid desaturase [Leptolyngbyaceae cyanobacterium bins.59]
MALQPFNVSPKPTELDLNPLQANWNALKGVTLSKEELRSILEIQPGRVYFDLGLLLVSLLAVPFLYRFFPNPLIFGLCILLNVRNLNSLAQLVHFSDHGCLLETPQANAIVGNLCAYLIGYTRKGHMQSHLKHHLYLNTPEDPDRIWGEPNQTPRQFLRMLLQDFFFLSALKRLSQYAQPSDTKASFSTTPWQKLSPAFLWGALKVMYPVILTQLTVLGFYSLVLGPIYYPLFYVLPIMTLYPALIRLRSAVEHNFEPGISPESQPQEITRSTHANWFERFIIAPLGTHHHCEHHLFPKVPYYHLPRVQQLMVDRGLEIPAAPGYFGFLWQKFALH